MNDVLCYGPAIKIFHNLPSLFLILLFPACLDAYFYVYGCLCTISLWTGRIYPFDFMASFYGIIYVLFLFYPLLLSIF